MEAYPKNQKMEEWYSKSEEERWEIAEENGWSWCFLWGDIGNKLRNDYERADKSHNVKDKYGGYDGWNKQPKKGEEFAPCTNKDCPWYDTVHWGEHMYKGANCGMWGDTDRMFECSDELFVLIQKWIDICGIEALDQLQREWNIHKDIIGWFKYGDKYFEQKHHIEKNREMFERWDKIRQKMGSYQIHIGIIHSDDQDELGIKRDDLYITKSLDKNGENFFEWLVTFKNGEVYDNDGGSPNYEEVINIKADIEWINIEMLENLEELYDIK